MAEKKENIKALILDALIERPLTFELSGRILSIYPPSLGKSYMTASLIEQLNINPLALNATPEMEMLRLSATQRDIVALLLAYSVCRTRDELFNSILIKDLVEFFTNCETTDCALLLYHVILNDNHFNDFIQHYGIDEEQRKLAECQRVKKNSSSLTFCGKSPWGSLIDFACERYGWTVDYALWGVSHTTLRMLMADSPRTVYLSDDEKKELHISTSDTEFFDANNLSVEEMNLLIN